jgi:hypothetical protein
MVTASVHTFQSVNGPLLELFQGDLRGRRCFIDVQTVGIVLLLVCWGSKLPFLGVNNSSSFRIDPMGVLSYHDEGIMVEKHECPRSLRYH